MVSTKIWLNLVLGLDWGRFGVGLGRLGIDSGIDVCLVFGNI